MTIHRRRGVAVACARADMEGTRRRRSRSRGVRLALLVAIAGGALLTLLGGPAAATPSSSAAQPVADLSVTAFGNFGSVALTVKNNGPGAATETVLTGSADGSWSLGGDAATCTAAAGGFSCPFGTLAPGAERTIFAITDEQCGGFFFVSGTASTTSDDPNPNNNTASDSAVPQGSCVECTVSVDANAGPDQTVASGATVTLQGGPDPMGVPTCGGGADAGWEQIAGPPVVLDYSSGLLTPHFTAPQALNGAVLTFRFTETNSGQSASDTVDITIKPQPVPFPDLPRALACADKPVPRADGTVGIAIDLDKATYDSGRYNGATFTLARFYRGVGATCENRGGSSTGETEFGYPVWK
jgi:hypothetical protein